MTCCKKQVRVPHCNTLKHNATNCNIRCSTRKHANVLFGRMGYALHRSCHIWHCNALPTHCNTLHHIMTCTTLQHSKSHVAHIALQRTPNTLPTHSQHNMTRTTMQHNKLLQTATHEHKQTPHCNTAHFYEVQKTKTNCKKRKLSAKDENKVQKTKTQCKIRKQANMQFGRTL